MTVNEFKEKLNELKFEDNDEITIVVDLDNGGSIAANVNRIRKDEYGDLEILAEE